MRTNFVTPEKYAKIFLKLAEDTPLASQVKPINFIRKMKENRGVIDILNPFGSAADGLERKNPVIVALGDSVTAGHFEFVGNPEELFKKIDLGEFTEDDMIEITDARECYLEKFRRSLIDKYEQTSVSTLNAGIAGDTIYGMEKRLYRDVIRYQPDLVLINASLNWPEVCGSSQDYEKVLKGVVESMKKETEADIILMTPNMQFNPPVGNPFSTLEERVAVIRRLAKEEEVCLADTYKVWAEYQALGYPVQELLANGINHPSIVGHEVYAVTLMKLLETTDVFE